MTTSHTHAITTPAGDAETIAAIATSAARPFDLEDGVVAYVVPEGYRIETVDPERYLDVPHRTRGTVELHDHGSLARYTVEHNDDERARLYVDADLSRPELVVVFNGPTRGSVGWGDHRARFAPRFTPEWKAWNAISGALRSQSDFAEFVEAHLADLVEPPAAEMLELARTFEADRRVEFRQSTVLESGQRQLTYQEVIDARAGASGQITVPSRVSIQVLVFEGGAAYDRVEARLRYRITDGTLKIGVDLIRPDLVVRRALEGIVEEVVQATGIDALMGTPIP